MTPELIQQIADMRDNNRAGYIALLCTMFQLKNFPHDKAAQHFNGVTQADFLEAIDLLTEYRASAVYGSAVDAAIAHINREWITTISAKQKG